MGFGGGDDAAKAIEEQERKRAAAISSGMTGIDQAFAGYNPQFYGQLQRNYLASALPQVGEQYRQTRNNLAFNLGQRGMLRSSASAGLGSSLQKQLAANETAVANQATQAVQDLQRRVQEQKNQVTQQLLQSANPQLARQQALETASGFSAPSLMQPLGNLFQNWSNIYLAQQTANAYKPLFDQTREGGGSGSNAPTSFTVK
jgi:hypothetical protein